MMMDTLPHSQSIIITLDVDAFIFDKLRTIVDAGFSMVELNGADQSILNSALHSFPLLRIGAGNVTNIQQLEEYHQAGAHFLTSPGFLPAIAQTALIYSINYLPGIATFSEAMQAMAVGCQTVRPYPATLTFCTLLNKYLPLLRLFPAEINKEETAQFLHLPAVAAVSILNPNIKELQTLNTRAAMI